MDIVGYRSYCKSSIQMLHGEPVKCCGWVINKQAGAHHYLHAHIYRYYR